MISVWMTLVSHPVANWWAPRHYHLLNIRPRQAHTAIRHTHTVWQTPDNAFRKINSVTSTSNVPIKQMNCPVHKHAPSRTKISANGNRIASRNSYGALVTATPRRTTPDLALVSCLPRERCLHSICLWHRSYDTEHQWNVHLSGNEWWCIKRSCSSYQSPLP